MKALNAKLAGNPVAQFALIGGLALVMIFILYVRVFSAGPAAEVAAPVPGAPGATPGAAPGQSPGAPQGSAPATAPVQGAAPPATGKSGASGRGSAAKPPSTGAGKARGFAASPLKPGPGLPTPVARAYAQGKGIVLLITQRNGIEDRLVRQSASVISKRKQMAVFKLGLPDISRYSRLTRGVEVSRTPALVVVAPRQAQPRATVVHGYLDRGSILQAVDDAIYGGKRIPPYPQ